MKEQLPQTAQALIGIIGLPDAIEFMRVFGGSSICTPRRFDKQKAMFSGVIGEAKAERLCLAHSGRGKWYIPRCLPLMNAERDRAIRADYDTGKFTRNNIVIKYSLSNSRVDDILKSCPKE